ncbi:MAG: pyridoxal-dependent decarboxylase [Candidatus Rokuibacteriota bacterium]|nr:MAG: pyridoxal-dependent decarboxylase [Candidatus Rokubacteria bacterium]
MLGRSTLPREGHGRLAAGEPTGLSPVALDELRRVVAKLESDVANGPIVPSVTPLEIRGYLASRYDFTKPLALDDVSADVERMLRTWQVQVTHPRYFGLFNPSVTLASIVGDTLVAMYNPQLATWRTSPAANEIERHTLAWLAGKFGFAADAVASFTNGGAEANLSAVVVALTRAFPAYGELGLRSLSASPTIYVTAEAHQSFNKIAHMTGLGRRAVRTVATDRELKMDPADLARRVAEDRKGGFAPFLVVGTAGTTAAGAIDPLPELARFCRSEGLWFHVDAAWGGAAILSPGLRSHLAGIEAADSITCDAHKWFSVPMAAGMFFCRHADAVREAFRVETSYMPGATTGPVLDPYRTSVQWSRRFIGLKLFLALAEHGESGYVEMIERQARMGDVLRASLTRAGWRVVNTTPLPLVCFTRDGLVTAKFLAALLERQVAWMSEVRLGGAPVVRACITSFRTTESDIEWVVREIGRLT